MKDNLGLGVMIKMLGGNLDTVETFQKAIGKKITSLKLDEDRLHFQFEDGYKMVMFDDGQSCCEHRYMMTDDDLSYFIGSTLLSAKIADGPNEEDEYGEHEVQFLIVTTSLGDFTMASHNEHNGYYGGFWIVAQEEN